MWNYRRQVFWDSEYYLIPGVSGRVRKLLCITFLVYIAMPFNVMAENTSSNDNNSPQFGKLLIADDSLDTMKSEEELRWLEKMKYYLSNYVNDFSAYIDRALSDPDDDELENRSYIALRSTAEYSHYGDFYSDSRVKLRIDLPNTQRKWHVIFETDADDNNSLESKQRDLVPESAGNTSNAAIGGIGVEEGVWTFWKQILMLGC